MNTEEEMVTNDLNEDLVYPYLTGYLMRMKIYFEQGMLTHNSDWSGFTKLTQTERKTRFFMTSYTDETYYPETSVDYIAGRPFEISIELSKRT